MGPFKGAAKRSLLEAQKEAAEIFRCASRERDSLIVMDLETFLQVVLPGGYYVLIFNV
jgi:hypothetical protein